METDVPVFVSLRRDIRVVVHPVPVAPFAVMDSSKGVKAVTMTGRPVVMDVRVRVQSKRATRAVVHRVHAVQRAETVFPRVVKHVMTVTT